MDLYTCVFANSFLRKKICFLKSCHVYYVYMYVCSDICHFGVWVARRYMQMYLRAWRKRILAALNYEYQICTACTVT